MDRIEYVMQPPGDEAPSHLQRQSQGCPFYQSEHGGQQHTTFPPGHPRVYPPQSRPQPPHSFAPSAGPPPSFNQDLSSIRNQEQSDHSPFDHSFSPNPNPPLRQPAWSAAPVSDFSWSSVPPSSSSSSSSSQPQPPRFHSHLQSQSQSQFSNQFSHSRSHPHARTASGYTHHFSSFGVRQGEPSGASFGPFSFDAPNPSPFQPGAGYRGGFGGAGAGAGAAQTGFPSSIVFTPPQRLPGPSSSSLGHQQSQTQNLSQGPNLGQQTQQQQQQQQQSHLPTGAPLGPRNFNFDRDSSSHVSFARNPTTRSSGIGRGHLNRGPPSRNSRSSFNRSSSSRSPPHRHPAMSQQSRGEPVEPIVISSGESSPIHVPSSPMPMSDPTTTPATAIRPPVPAASTSNPPPGGPTRQAYISPVAQVGASVAGPSRIGGSSIAGPSRVTSGYGASGPADRMTLARQILARQARAAEARREAMGSDESDDEEFEPLNEEEEDTIRFIFSAEEGDIRGFQVFRGQLDLTKRKATKKAIKELQNVKIDELPEKERTCTICYNDYGAESPEGITEQPLRLPKCKHVFGNYCIKKWFKESDSCPYCRDKLPSELALPPGTARMFELIRRERRARQVFDSMSSTPRRVASPPISYERGEPSSSASRSEASPPRSGWPQTGERRSSPSEGSENSRRTRPRHFESSASSFGSDLPFQPTISGSPPSFSGSAQVRERSPPDAPALVPAPVVPAPVFPVPGNNMNNPGGSMGSPFRPTLGSFPTMPSTQRPSMANPDGQSFSYAPPFNPSMRFNTGTFPNSRRLYTQAPPSSSAPSVVNGTMRTLLPNTSGAGSSTSSSANS